MNWKMLCAPKWNENTLWRNTILLIYTRETKYFEAVVDQAGWIPIASQLDNLCMRMRKENVLLALLVRCRILHHCRPTKPSRNQWHSIAVTPANWSRAWNTFEIWMNHCMIPRLLQPVRTVNCLYCPELKVQNSLPGCDWSYRKGSTPVKPKLVPYALAISAHDGSSAQWFRHNALV